jgi:hypothetical protein
VAHPVQPVDRMLESLLAPLFFVLLAAIVIGVAYIRRRSRGPGRAVDVVRTGSAERHRKTGIGLQ